MANPNERSKQLADFGLTEELLRALFTSKDPADGVWLAEHELKMHKAWAEERHRFILDEISKKHPAYGIPGRKKPKKSTPPHDGPPIVSHRGRTRSDPVFGETYG